MTKQEYENQRDSITKQYGKPEYDFDRTPLNEAGTRLKELQSSYMRSIQESKRAAKRLERVSEEVKKIENSPQSEAPIDQETLDLNIPISLEPFLEQFTETEQRIIKLAVNFPYWSATKIASQTGSYRQFVVAFLTSERYLQFRGQLFVHWQQDMTPQLYGKLMHWSKSTDKRIAMEASKLLLEYQESKAKEKAAEGPQHSIKDAFTREVIKKVSDWITGGYKDDLVLKGPQK